MKTYLRFYFGQFQSVGLAMWRFYFRVMKFPFISRFRVGFETQLMETTKLSRTVSKKFSQGIRCKSSVSYTPPRILMDSIRSPGKLLILCLDSRYTPDTVLMDS